MNKYYSNEEVSDHLGELDKPTLTRLMKISWQLTLKFRRISGEDLLQDVLRKVIEGKRRWPRQVDLFTFLINTIKSDLGNLTKHERRKGPPILSLSSKNHLGMELESQIADQRESIEHMVVRQGLYDDVMNLFTDDPIAQELIEGLTSGMTRSDLLELLDISETDYNSKRRKIRRRIEKIKDGGTKDE